MRMGTKILSLFLAVLMFVMALPITTFAAKQETYIKEIRISTADTEDEAKQWLIDNDYLVLDINLNQKTGKDAVYMGYKTTTNPDEAITDLSLMQMDGGYSFAEYEAVLKQQEEDVRTMLTSFTTAVEEFRANYAAGKKNAVEAYKMMNRFKEDDSGKLLGDFVMDHGDDLSLMTKLFMQSNRKIVIFMYQMFALSCTDYGMESNWLAAFAKADPYGDYNPLEYDDAASDIFDNWVDFRKTLLKAKSYLEDMNEVGGGEEYTEIVGQGQSASDASDIAIYLAIESYQYNGKSMLEFFLQDPDELDLADFYPMLSAMTPGQIECVKAIGFTPIVQYALMDDEGIGKMSETLLEQLGANGFNDIYSVYANVDRSLFNGEGIALTNQALRESASTGESAWFKGNMDPGIETLFYVLTGVTAAMTATFTTMAVMTAGPAKAALAFYMEHGFQLTGWYTEAQLSAMNLNLENVFYTFTTAKIVAGICLGVTLILSAIYIGIEVYNYLHPEYTEIPRIIVDEVVTDTDHYYVNYYCARDQKGELGDLNAWSAQRWNALYATTDRNAGDPIVASSLSVKLKDSTFPDEESAAVHYFGEAAAANVNRYNFKRTAPATYIFYKRDHSLSMTASTFSGGQLVMFTGFGVLGGVVIGSLSIIGANKLKKKKEKNEA